MIRLIFLFLISLLSQGNCPEVFKRVAPVEFEALQKFSGDNRFQYHLFEVTKDKYMIAIEVPRLEHFSKRLAEIVAKRPGVYLKNHGAGLFAAAKSICKTIVVGTCFTAVSAVTTMFLAYETFGLEAFTTAIEGKNAFNRLVTMPLLTISGVGATFLGHHMTVRLTKKKIKDYFLSAGERLDEVEKLLSSGKARVQVLTIPPNKSREVNTAAESKGMKLLEVGQFGQLSE